MFKEQESLNKTTKTDLTKPTQNTVNDSVSMIQI